VKQKEDTEMESKERIKLALERKIPDRIPKLEICFWDETIERWKKEGLPENVTPEEYFDLDKIHRVYFDGTLRLDEKTLEEDEETRVYTENNGIKYKAFKNKTYPPVPIGSLISSREEWENYKHRINVDFSRLSQESIDAYKHAVKENRYIIISPSEPMWYTIKLLYEAEALIKTVTDPDFIEEIVAYYTEFNIGMLEELFSNGFEFDALWFFSDLCYKNGMIFSPDFFRERVMPYQKRIYDFCKSKNMKIIYHCCGNVNRILPLLIEAGIDCIQPMEARAGNDVREYKRLYGNQIAFMGNISVDVMGTTRNCIEEEIKSKITIAKEGGGYIYHSDHSIPPSVSFENYCTVMEMVNKYGKY